MDTTLQGKELEPPRTGAGEDGTHSTRCRIIDAAERLFRHFGFQKTTVADIARDLSMSPANVYRFFASKAAITEAVATQLTGEVEAIAAAAAATEGLTAQARLARVIHATHEASLQRYIADKRMHAMVRAAIEESWGMVRAHKARMLDIVARLIAEGVAAGEFDVADPHAAAQCFQASFIIVCHPQIVEHALREGEDVGTMIDLMLAFCFRALGAKAPTASAT